MNKIKEKKLNSIKAEMEEIKKYIASSDSFNITNQNDYDYSNKNANDTLTLTKVVKQENKLFYKFFVFYNNIHHVSIKWAKLPSIVSKRIYFKTSF